MRKVILLSLFLLFVFATVVPIQGQVIFSENFNELELMPFPSESGGDGTDWTNTPPEGWSIDNSQMGAEGREEWQGWAFADRLAWAGVDDQRRSDFTKADGVVAIADPDEWDDVNSPSSTGEFNSFLISPEIDVTGFTGDTALTFTSSWRPWDTMTATVIATFDDGSEVQIVRFSSESGDPDFKNDESTNDFIRAPFTIPAGASTMTLTFGLTLAGNDWFWAIDDIAVVAGGVPPMVSRSFEALAVPAGQTTTVSLNVVLEDNTKTVEIVETVPEGWSVSEISNDGTFADGHVTWALSDFTGTTTLTYDVTLPEDQEEKGQFSGTVDGGIKVFGSDEIGLVSALGVFENHLDIGAANPEGDLTFDGVVYTMMGAGKDVWGNDDEFHYAYIETSGPVSFKVERSDLFALNGDATWAKFGPMIRNDLSADSAHGFALINSNSSFVPQWRPSQGSSSFSSANSVEFGIHGGFLEAERIGDYINFYYVDQSTGERTFHSSQLIEMEDPIYVGAAITSNVNGELSEAFFESPEIIEYPYGVIRQLPSEFPWRGTLEGVELTVMPREGETPDVTITETPPAGWEVTNAVASDGDVNVSDGVITWTLTGVTGEPTLTYDVASTDDSVEAEWQGAVSGSGVETLVAGNRMVSANFTQIPEGYGLFLFEDFENLELEPFVDESGGDGTDFTHTPPEGWSIDNSLMGAPGVTEWQGWSFADKDAWVSVAGDQRRSEFTRGQGTVAIADPDEWDDKDSPSSIGEFNSFMTTETFSISGRTSNEMLLNFDHTWRPWDTMTATVTASFDGGPAVDIVRFSSDEADPDYLDDNSTNLLASVPFTVPEGASSMSLTFGLTLAGNDWFWAVDNIAVIGEGDGNVTSVPNWNLY